MTTWTHKVVKRQRGGDGKWFSYPAAATFGTEQEAREYALAFAKEQSDVAGTKIDVQTRGGRTVCEINTRSGQVFECDPAC